MDYSPNSSNLNYCFKAGQILALSIAFMFLGTSTFSLRAQAFSLSNKRITLYHFKRLLTPQSFALFYLAIGRWLCDLVWLESPVTLVGRQISAWHFLRAFFFLLWLWFSPCYSCTSMLHLSLINLESSTIWLPKRQFFFLSPLSHCSWGTLTPLARVAASKNRQYWSFAL